jgi:hypothetical protein
VSGTVGVKEIDMLIKTSRSWNSTRKFLPIKKGTRPPNVVRVNGTAHAARDAPSFLQTQSDEERLNKPILWATDPSLLSH